MSTETRTVYIYTCDLCKKKTEDSEVFEFTHKCKAHFDLHMHAYSGADDMDARDLCKTCYESIGKVIDGLYND